MFKNASGWQSIKTRFFLLSFCCDWGWGATDLGVLLLISTFIKERRIGTLEYKQPESETGNRERSLLKIIWKWFIGRNLYPQWFLVLLLFYSTTEEDSNLLWAKGKLWSIAKEGRKNILKEGVWGTCSLPWWCSVCRIFLEQSVPKPVRQKGMSRVKASFMKQRRESEMSWSLLGLGLIARSLGSMSNKQEGIWEYAFVTLQMPCSGGWCRGIFFTLLSSQQMYSHVLWIHENHVFTLVALYLKRHEVQQFLC